VADPGSAGYLPNTGRVAAHIAGLARALVVLCGGTMGLSGGARYVVEAARQLQQRNVLILFVGEGTARDEVAGVEDDSDTAEWLRRSDCGLVVPPQDPEALAEAICRLADRPALRERMGNNGRRYVVEHFSKAAALARYLALFENVAR
jgi:glycosyltransferase involved in cell wall biosynthesis